MSEIDFSNDFDRAVAGTYERREADWRNGAVVYQILVDRFAPPADLESKRHLYPAPKTLKSWDEVPTRGVYLEDQKLWSHEIDFWGGDLAGVREKWDYIKSLDVDVVYLNPIHLSYTNHRYDALDYAEVTPEFGDRDDVKELAKTLHEHGMRLVLDGVFNHMGRNSERFKEAMADPKSKFRDWFFIGEEFPGGARSWWLAENLPELNLENPKVRKYVYGGKNSIVRSFLRDGVDGWRLDVAVDIGMKWLQELTDAAHEEKPGSLVVGEIANYPKEWFPSVDAVMNFSVREIILKMMNGAMNVQHAQRMINRIYGEPGYEHMLKSWLFLDNHDTARLAHALPDGQRRHLAQLLQFTLPGAPNLYYGTEIGMDGGDDPEMRAPMRWDWVSDHNSHLIWTKRLIQLRKDHRALRVGDYRPLETDRLFGFERYTDRVEDTVIVLVNPTHETITEPVMIANSKLMNTFKLLNIIDDSGDFEPIYCGITTVTIPAGGFKVFAPEIHPDGGYSAYKRVQ